MNRRPVRITVSDHAVLRWLEREHGLDVTAVRALLSGQVLSAAEMGALAVCVGKVRLVLVGADAIGPQPVVTVVTALPRRSTAGRAGGRHG